MITFNCKESRKEALRITTWADVFFKDGEEDEEPIKKITLTIDAGNVAVLNVERYVMGNHFTNLSSDPYEKDSKPLTKTNTYMVGKDITTDAQGNLNIDVLKAS